MSPNSPLITIITVVYNGISSLEQTILSVINNVNKNIEYIIVDGASTDGSVNIIKKYQQYISFWVSEADKGIYDAMNKGAQFANAPYILYINSGDILLPFDFDFLDQNYDCDVFYGNILKDGQIVRPLNISALGYAMPFCHQATIIKSSLVRKFGFDNTLKIAADFDLMQRLFIAKNKFKYVDLLIAEFEGGGISSTMNNRYVKEYVSIIKKNKMNAFWWYSLLKFYRNLFIQNILNIAK